MPTVLWVTAALTAQDPWIIGELRNFEVQVCHDLARLGECVAKLSEGVVFVRLPVQGVRSYDLLETIQRANPAVPVVFHHPLGKLSDATELIRQGAFHCLLEGLHFEPLRRTLEAALEYGHTMQLRTLALKTSREPWRELLIGESPAMQQVIEMIRLVGPRCSTVLITGETGTGKEVAARAIHGASGRASLPMVAVNCAALPETLLEAELFGHTKGAFTGAVGQRAGRFEQAHHSTIFLDEIGDVPLDIQCKLLRVLQEREFQRIGSTETTRVDTRVIAATNRDLVEAVKQRTFREDLYYRLKVVCIEMPALRQRSSDIPLLVEHFLEKVCRKEGLAPKCVAPEALDRLAEYTWPGNIRQLEHTVETAIVLSGERRVLHARDFALPETQHFAPRERLLEMPAEGLDFEQMISEIQRYLLHQALEKTGGNKARAAEMLHMKRSTLVSKVKSLG